MDSHSRRIILSLKTCLLLPALVFICLFSLFFILLNSYQTSSFLDKRLEKEALRISNIAYEYRFVLNDSYLKMLGKVIEGEIAVLNQNGKIVSASFNKDTGNRFQDVIKRNKILERHGLQNKDQVALAVVKATTCCYIISRRIPGKQKPGSILYCHYDEPERFGSSQKNDVDKNGTGSYGCPCRRHNALHYCWPQEPAAVLKIFGCHRENCFRPF